jgi:hypothetical protein
MNPPRANSTTPTAPRTQGTSELRLGNALLAAAAGLIGGSELAGTPVGRSDAVNSDVDRL